MDLNSDLIRGHIDTIILGLLRTNDRYGYEICRIVREKSGGEYELKEPSMYSTIRRLESQRLIEAYWGDESQGARRKYYRITAAGQKAFTQNLANWQFAKKIIDTLLEVEE